MKLIAVFCFCVVFQMDSVYGMDINDFLSHIPGWETLSSIWNQIKEAIKRPVRIRRLGQIKKRKTTTTPRTTTTTKSTSTTVTPSTVIPVANKTNMAPNSSKELIGISKLMASANSNSSSVHQNVSKPIIPLILTPLKNIMPFTNKSISMSKPSTTQNLSTSSKTLTSVKPRGSSVGSTIIEKRPTPMKCVTTPTAKTITKILPCLPVKSDAVSSEITTTPLPYGTKVKVPYIKSPVYETTESRERMQSTPLENALRAENADYATKSNEEKIPAFDSSTHNITTNLVE